jgi:tRNA(fMet)-specific endonuclease VapC
VAIAAITVAELRVGVELSSGKAKVSRSAFLDDVMATIPVIDYDSRIAEVHAQLLVAVRQQGRSRGAHDLIIASTALGTKRTILTADQSAFPELPGVVFRLHR